MQLSIAEIVVGNATAGYSRTKGNKRSATTGYWEADFVLLQNSNSRGRYNLYDQEQQIKL
eukprot:3232014-Rhodomonas_salina.2